MIPTHYISFPGLGIGPMKINPVAIENFLGRQVMWYGIIICVGMILAFLYGTTRVKKEGLSEDDFYTMFLITIPVAIIFARAYYVIFDPNPTYETFIDYIAIWNGGIAIYGGIIGGVIAIFTFSKIKKIKFTKLLDIAGSCVIIGQIVGRWGNFMNGEAHGGICTNFLRMGIAYTEVETPIYYHPTFLYESLWNLVGFLLIHFVIYKHKKYDGQVFFFYAAWYGLGRGFIELLRTDSLMIGGIRVSSLLGFVCFAVFFTVNVILKNREIKNGNNN